ncbi:hypothetical protein Tco_0245512 [Tanacetum coccineum]
MDNRLIRVALAFDMNKSKIEHQQLQSLLNPEQCLIYEHVIQSLDNQEGQFYFVYDPGGTDKYCPRNKMKKLKAELWNLKVIGTDVVKYNQRFQELALLCVRMFPEESDKIKRYVGGLPDTIHGNIVASRLKTMQEAVEMATETRGSLKTLPETIKININNKIRGRTQARPTLQAIVTGNHTPGLNLCVPSVITIMKVLVHLSTVIARGLAIWPRIVEADLQMLTTTTATTTIIIRMEMVAMSAELKDILEENAQN